MTTMLQVHARALASQADVYHLFLSKYSKISSIVYGVVEGQTDPSFYKTYVETLIPNDWAVNIIFVKGKKNVLRLYNEFDWDRFPRKRIAFFVDRDLSQVLGEAHPDGENIYITDGYSIENSVVTRSTCKRVFEEIYNLHQASEIEFDLLLQKFDEQIERYFKLMIPVMAYISLWRSRREKVNLNNVKLNRIFTFYNGKIILRREYQSRKEFIGYFYRTCGVKDKNRSGVKSFEKIFKAENIYRNFTRGKYLIWFFVAFCEDCHANCLELCPSLQTHPTKTIALTEGNALTVIGQRARIPSSLRAFLQQTFLGYIESRCCAE